MEHFAEQAAKAVPGRKQKQIKEHGKKEERQPGDGFCGKGHTHQDTVQGKSQT